MASPASRAHGRRTPALRLARARCAPGDEVRPARRRGAARPLRARPPAPPRAAAAATASPTAPARARASRSPPAWRSPTASARSARPPGRRSAATATWPSSGWARAGCSSSTPAAVGGALHPVPAAARLRLGRLGQARPPGAQAHPAEPPGGALGGRGQRLRAPGARPTRTTSGSSTASCGRWSTTAAWSAWATSSWAAGSSTSCATRPAPTWTGRSSATSPPSPASSTACWRTTASRSARTARSGRATGSGPPFFASVGSTCARERDNVAAVLRACEAIGGPGPGYRFTPRAHPVDGGWTQQLVVARPRRQRGGARRARLARAAVSGGATPRSATRSESESSMHACRRRGPAARGPTCAHANIESMSATMTARIVTVPPPEGRRGEDHPWPTWAAAAGRPRGPRVPGRPGPAVQPDPVFGFDPPRCARPRAAPGRPGRGPRGRPPRSSAGPNQPLLVPASRISATSRDRPGLAAKDCTCAGAGPGGRGVRRMLVDTPPNLGAQ